jgi:predicted RND superfamily exporter protein
VVAVFGMAQLTINSSPYIIDQSHPARLNETAIKRTFTHTGEHVFVVLTPEGAVTNDFLQLVKVLHEHIEKISITESYLDPVIRVSSLLNSTYIPNQDDIDYDKLWNQAFPPDSFSEVQDSINSTKRFSGILSDQHFSSLALIVELSIPAEDANAMELFLLELESITAQLLPDVDFNIVGSSVVSTEVGKVVKNDNTIFFPIISLLIAVVLWFSFKNIFCVMAPLCITTLTVLWVAGIMGFAGISINIITVVLPVFLVTIAVADSIHYLSKIKHLTARGENIRASNIIAIRELIKPLGSTSITTALGFIALSYTHLTYVSQFGVFTAIGVAIAFVLSMTLLPALSLDLSNFEKVVKWPYTANKSMFTKINQSLYQIRYIFSLVLFMLVLAAVAISLNITPGFSNIHSFKHDTKLRMDIDHVHSRYIGTVSADILVEQLNPKENIIDIDNLYNIEQLQVKLEEHTSISKTYSIVDLFKEIDKSISSSGFKPSIREFSTRLLNQYLIIIQSDPNREVLSLYNEFSSNLRIIVFADTDDGAIWREVNNIIKEHSNSAANMTYKLSGFGGIAKAFVDEVVNGQINSLILSILSITLVMMFLFRSVILGLLGIIPLLLTLLINFSVMTLSNITLDIATSMVIGIAFGIGVDYSIHLITGLKDNMAVKDSCLEDAIGKTLHDIATPIGINTLSLTIGFIILLSSSFQPIKNLGLLISLSLVLCTLFTLIVIPFLIRLLPDKIAAYALHGKK